ncbi:CHAT domain-containing protein [Agromyces sp. NPDC058484]|uniref:CHAT domain-containing protein n=1 Tax=Agromyces sp. NPDC058484 TaxID=3346524 RepID=UPI00364C3D44
MDTVMELEIGPGPEPGAYVVHVLRSVGGGEPTATFALDLDELVDRRPKLEESILASAVMARRVVPTTEAAIQDVGRRLFDAVFQGDVHTAYRTSLAVASDRGTGIQLLLRLSAPGLVALPWEALFDPETATYLCRKEPLVRRVPARHTPAALAIDPPLRILGMVSSPRGLPPLDVEAEKALLEDALRPQIDAGRVKISWVEPVTWSAVHDRLLSREWHVLHFIGHGTYDPVSDEGLLAFVGQDGRTHNVPASSLADLIDEADPSPRLVLLNTCSSGTGGRDDLFSGTAGALAHSGIHAVAAMQFEISDRAAIEFSRGFYTALAHGRRIDDAVRSGRIEILGLGQGTLEWVTPVLYLRGDDTRLFDVAPIPETGMVMKRADVSSRPVPAPVPVLVPVRTEPQPTADRSPSQPIFHAADSGDIPSTMIPKQRADAAGPPRPPDQSPPNSSPAAGGRRARATPRLKPWLVAGLITAVAIAGALATMLTVRPGGGPADDRADGTPVATPPTPPVTSTPSTPPIVVTILGTELEKTTGMRCVAGDAFELEAAGAVLLNRADPDSSVGPEGWRGGDIGYESFYGFEPGQLAVGLYHLDAGTYSAFDETGRAAFECPEPGELWLVIDDLISSDNDGSFTVQIWQNPPAG